MKYYLKWAAVLLMGTPSVPYAQTNSTCQWIGNIWTCNQSAPAPQVDWGRLRDPSTSVTDSVERGLAIGERARRARQEREQHEARMELYRAQTEAARNQTAQAPSPNSTIEPPQYVQLWYKRAQPRMALYPDFSEKVFAEDAPITPDMVTLMSGSEYAADIAYYLATNQAEARIISQLHVLDAARSILRIEAQFSAQETAGKQ